MPKMPRNIEKSAFCRRAYTGYGGGLTWHITKTNSSFGNWLARPVNWINEENESAHENRDVYAMRLADMGEKLATL